jgi:hypothetical protein
LFFHRKNAPFSFPHDSGRNLKPFETLCDVGGATGLLFGDAFDLAGADFRRFEVIPLAGASSAAVAYK